MIFMMLGYAHRKKVSQLIQIFQKPQIQNDSEIHLYLLKFPGRA